MGRDLRVRFRRWRVKVATRLFARSRAARWVFLAAVFPFVHVADRLRRIDPPASWKVGMHWVRTGRDWREPAIRTAGKPAVLGRRHRRVECGE